MRGFESRRLRHKYLLNQGGLARRFLAGYSFLVDVADFVAISFKILPPIRLTLWLVKLVSRCLSLHDCGGMAGHLANDGIRHAFHEKQGCSEVPELMNPQILHSRKGPGSILRRSMVVNGKRPFRSSVLPQKFSNSQKARMGVRLQA